MTSDLHERCAKALALSHYKADQLESPEDWQYDTPEDLAASQWEAWLPEVCAVLNELEPKPKNPFLNMSDDQLRKILTDVKDGNWKKEKPEMNIVIEKSGVTRELKGPFRICLSAKDAQTLIGRLRNKTEENFSYGWVDIYDIDEPVPNSPPIGWTE